MGCRAPGDARFHGWEALGRTLAVSSGMSRAPAVGKRREGTPRGDWRSGSLGSFREDRLEEQLQDWLQAPRCRSIPRSPSDPGSHPMTMKLHFAEEKKTQSQESHLRPFIHSFSYPLQIALTEPVLSA
uniref:Uncharacterized protein n=1 Tax=Rousettus aegyptiacus TaxID=9407 RepID=A0A7J8H295_ROUAE|nr:hypothetical protein HJG63_011385 [Rousettus aegyptiacus]